MRQDCVSDGVEHADIDIVEGCGLPPLDWDAVQLPASLLVFFLVFYGSNCYNRFYQLWALCIELMRLVLEFVARINLVFPGHAKITCKWRAARCMLASLAMLFNMLGGDLAESDPFRGMGVDEGEYNAFVRLQLLSRKEVDQLKKYKGVKCVIPVKWALLTIKSNMNFATRDDLHSKYYDTLEDLACEFQSRCYTVILLLQQPVPFAYFHVLKLQMLVVLLLLGYSLVNVFEGHWYFSALAYVVVAFTMLGLQEIAVAMSDPFGDDDSDFDTTKLVEHAYNNVLEYFSEDSDINDGGDTMLVFRRKKRFASFGVDIHGDPLDADTTSEAVPGALLGKDALKSDDPRFVA